ncbi:hypothetical protein Ahy_B03g064939 [Arachis hypogaea]|uniref:Uncharacterized protein n=1 Tax=Arachis hypogaea TaxID=3818 RepID=A0A445A0N2_ARAHY|nr:hypothetical protein Ahy_B03g064939 [Arachis hypogaea]
MNRYIREITDKIKEKISEKDYVASGMRSPYYWKMEWRCRVARKGKILSNLYVALDELCFMNNAPRRRSKKEKCFTEEEIDNHNLNSLMRHGSMSLTDEKKRADANAFAKGKIPGYVSMKNSVKDQIKVSYGIDIKATHSIIRCSVMNLGRTEKKRWQNAPKLEMQRKIRELQRFKKMPTLCFKLHYVNFWAFATLRLMGMKITTGELHHCLFLLGTHSIVKYFGGQVPSSSSFNQPLGNAFDEAVPSSLSGSENYSGLISYELQQNYPEGDTKIKNSEACLHEQDPLCNLSSKVDSSPKESSLESPAYTVAYWFQHI